MSDDDVIEYMVSTTNTTIELFALRRRLDKIPQTASAIEATFSDAIENIQPEELIR